MTKPLVDLHLLRIAKGFFVPQLRSLALCPAEREFRDSLFSEKIKKTNFLLFGFYGPLWLCDNRRDESPNLRVNGRRLIVMRTKKHYSIRTSVGTLKLTEAQIRQGYEATMRDWIARFEKKFSTELYQARQMVFLNALSAEEFQLSPSLP